MPRRPRLQLCALEDRTTPTAGLMDTTFGGGDGIALIGSVPNYFSSDAQSVIVQSDSKIVFAGSIDSPTGSQGFIGRFDTEGSRDTSFNSLGYMAGVFGGTRAAFNGVALQPDGKIVATGYATFSGASQALIVRFNANGTLDSTFSSDGIVTLNPTSGDESGAAIAVQPDGKLVISGRAENNKFLMARVNADGSPDNGFDLDGIFLNQPSGTGAWGLGITLQPDGKIIGIGGGDEPGSNDLAVVLMRLNPDGSLDSTFSGDGIAATIFNGNGESEGNDVEMMPDGRILAGGKGTVGAYGQHAAAMFLADGTLDSSFGSNGQVIFNLPNSEGGEIEAIESLPNGDIIACGSIVFPGSQTIVMRMHSDGSMDTSFGIGNQILAPGVVVTDASSNEEVAWDLALGADGRIVLTGHANGQVYAVRYTGDNDGAALPDSYSTSEDQPLFVPAPGVLANDENPDPAAPVAALATGPSHASSFTLNPDGSFSYVPEPNFSGVDSFTYSFSAGPFTSLPTTVTITVNSANDPPAAVDDGYMLPRMTPLQISVNAANGVLANDTDPENNALTAVLVSAPAVGTLNLNSDGSFSYSFPASLTGPVTFTYKANDGTVDGTSATVTLTRQSNQIPVAADETFEFPLQSPLNVSAPGVLANDSDPEGDAIVAELVTQPDVGTVTMQVGGSFQFAYPAGFIGTTSFAYRVFDGRDYSLPATVTLSYGPNLPPIAVDDSYAVGLGGALNVPAANGVNANDSDPEGNAFTASIVSQPAIGQVTLNPDGSFSYTGGQNLVGSVTFTYQLSDADAPGNIATVTLTRENIFTGADSTLVIVGSAADESLRLSAAGKKIVLERHTASGIVREVFTPSAAAKRFTKVKIALGAGDDRIDTTLIGLPVEIDAAAGNNVIRTGKGHDIIVVGDGRNSIETGKGNDLITAGDGGNVIDAEAGNDTVTTGAGADWVVGAAGSDVIDLGDGNDYADGGAGKDLIVGGLGSDFLIGSAGADILIDGTIALTNPNSDSLAKILKAFVPSKKAIQSLSQRFTATNDSLVEAVFGGAGTDWFFGINDETDRLDKEPLGPSI